MVQAKRKGTRVEREFVKWLNEAGLKASRVPGSGAFMGTYGDIDLTIGENDYKCEVKARANGEGFRKLEEWLGANDFLFLKKDRSSPMVCMTFDVFIGLLKDAKDGCEYENISE